MRIHRRTFLLAAGGAGLALVGAGGWFAVTRRPAGAQVPWDDVRATAPDVRLDAFRHAILAPNPHNRQPWQIRLVGPDAAIISCDLARRLPHTDPFDRQIVIGFGCFLELARIAAAERGVRMDTQLFPAGEGAPRLTDAGYLWITSPGNSRADQIAAGRGARAPRRTPSRRRIPPDCDRRHSGTDARCYIHSTGARIGCLQEAVMPRWYEHANEASFKATLGGYVFQAPSPWVFARPRYYLVNDTQKARALSGLGRWRLHLLVASLINAAVMVAIIGSLTLWPATFVRPMVPWITQLGVAPFMLLLFALLLLVMVPIFAVPQILLARALAPVVADAPTTQERIKVSEQLPGIATSVSGRLLVIGLISALGMIAGGALFLVDAAMDGHVARSAPAVVVLLSAGALMAGYFGYLLRLKAKQKRSAAA